MQGQLKKLSKAAMVAAQKRQWRKAGVHNVRITFYNTLHFPFDLLPFGNFPQLKCACGICTMSNRGRWRHFTTHESERRKQQFLVFDSSLFSPLSQKYSTSIFLPFPIICYHHHRVEKRIFEWLEKRLNLSCIIPARLLTIWHYFGIKTSGWLNGDGFGDITYAPEE